MVRKVEGFTSKEMISEGFGRKHRQVEIVAL